jgi:hypothetical protein
MTDDDLDDVAFYKERVRMVHTGMLENARVRLLMIPTIKKEERDFLMQLRVEVSSDGKKDELNGLVVKYNEQLWGIIDEEWKDKHDGLSFEEWAVKKGRINDENENEKREIFPW